MGKYLNIIGNMWGLFFSSTKWLRWIPFIVVFIITGILGIRLWLGQPGLGSSEERQVRQVIEKVIGRIAKTDPEAAERIRAAAKSRPASQEGLALALLFQEKIGKKGGVEELAPQLEQGSPLVEFLKLAVDKSEFPDEESRNGFLMAHGAILAIGRDKEILTDRDQAQNTVRQHLQRIERARRSPDWAKLKSDAVSVWILDGVNNQELRSYYFDNREWLGETLVEFRTKNEKGEADSPGPGDWEELIAVAKRYHPLTREAVTGTRSGEIAQEGNGGGSEAFAMFLDHGEVIKKCADQGLPVLETVSVLFANPGWNESAEISQKVERLVNIHRNRKAIWAMAMVNPQILVLDEKVSQYSEKLIEDYGHDDIASLILNVCEGFEEPAAHAVIKHGDIALSSIQKYAKMEQFRDGILKPGGFRVPAYLMIKGNPGLNMVGNTANIDKEFDAKGDPIGGWGWKDVPILGGPVNIVRNWANGATNEWSELGWAALDFADGVVLVASFGSSGPATASRQAAKAAAKKIAMEGAEAAAKSAAKGAREAAKQAFRKAPALGFKGGLLARLGRAGEVIGTTAAKLAQLSSYTYRGARFVIGGMSKVINRAFMATKGAYSALPSGVKKAIKGAFLVVSLSYSITVRTFPAIQEMIKDGISVVADTFNQTITNFRNGINTTIRDLADQMRSGGGGILNWLLLVPLGFLTIWLFPGFPAFRRT